MSARLDQREGREGGFVALAALVLMILIGATVLAVLTDHRINVNTAREGRDFAQARQGLSAAFADAAYTFNATDNWAATPTHSDPGGRWAWAYDDVTLEVVAVGSATPMASSALAYDSANHGFTVITDGHVAIASEAPGIETASRPIRGRWTGSYSSEDGVGIYGIAANGPTNNGAWSSLLSIGGSALFGGTLTGDSATRGADIAIYSAGTVKRQTNSPTQITAYSDGATATNAAGQALDVHRSSITARLDQNLLGDRLGSIGSGCISANRIHWKGAGTDLCSGNNKTIPATTCTWAGVRTLAVKGTVKFDGAINLGPSCELHIYAGGTSVTFNGALTPAILKSVFVFAPNADCSTAASVALQLTGAMACSDISLPNAGNALTYRAPKPETNLVGRSSQIIYFTEPSGYIDSITP